MVTQLVAHAAGESIFCMTGGDGAFTERVCDFLLAFTMKSTPLPVVSGKGVKDGDGKAKSVDKNSKLQLIDSGAVFASLNHS